MKTTIKTLYKLLSALFILIIPLFHSTLVLALSNNTLTNPMDSSQAAMKMYNIRTQLGTGNTFTVNGTNMVLASADQSDVTPDGEPEEFPVKIIDITDITSKPPTNGAPAKLDGYTNYRGIFPTAQLQNFPELRNTVDKIFGIATATNGVKVGVLYISDNQNTCYNGAVSNDEIWTEGKLASKEVQDALKIAAKSAYKDIKGNEWYTSKLALMTYYGVVSGKTDKAGNTMFDGGAAVTRAEYMTMFTRWARPSSYVYDIMWEGGKGVMEKAFGGDQWYVPGAISAQGAAFIDYSSGLNKALLNKPMTRMECVYLIMTDLYPGETGLAFGNGRDGISTKATWKDTLKSRNLYKQLNLMKTDEYGVVYTVKGANLKVFNEMIAHPEKGIDTGMKNVLELARKKGLVGGTANNTIEWNKSVTRAEAIQMLHTASVLLNQSSGGHAVKY